MLYYIMKKAKSSKGTPAVLNPPPAESKSKKRNVTEAQLVSSSAKSIDLTTTKESGMEVSSAEPIGLYRSIEIKGQQNNSLLTFSKEEAQVASVMTNIFSNLKELSKKIVPMFQSYGNLTQLNIDLNQGQEKTFIVFVLASSASGQSVKQSKIGMLFITNKNPNPNAPKSYSSEKSEETENLLIWLEKNGNKPTREELNGEEQSVINALLLFYFNLYRYQPQPQPQSQIQYRPIILPYFTRILSSLLSKGYSDSAIFLEAAKQKFIPEGQELSVNICQSSDKLASLLASYINGVAVGIRKTPKTQDAYIMIMDQDILDFLVDITTGQILSEELHLMLDQLHFIKIDGTQLAFQNTTDKMIDILRGIRDLKFKMQQTLLEQGENGSPEDILNLSFEALAKKYVGFSGKPPFSNYVKFTIDSFSLNPDPRNTQLIELKIIQNYFILKNFSQQMQVVFLPPPSEKELAPMDVSSSSEAVQASQKAHSSDSKKAAPSSSRQFYSFLLVLFFEAFPNLRDLRGQEDPQHRAIFSAFYDFLNGHDFKIKNLIYVVDIVLPGFFTGFERELLRNVENYHEDEEAIYRFSEETRKVTFLLNANMWKTQFTYYNNANNLLNKQFTQDDARVAPTLELFELVPCATSVTSFNDFKVGKEIAGPQLNPLKINIISSIEDFIIKTQCQSVIDPNDCVNYVMSRVFFRVTDAVTLVSMFDSGSPPLFAAKCLIPFNPETDGSSGSNEQQIIISTGDDRLPIVQGYQRDPFLPTKELIKEFYGFLTSGIVQGYPFELSLQAQQRQILRLFPSEYQTWYDQWINFLFLQLKTPSSNSLAVGKKRAFLVSLANKYINQPKILLSDQMISKEYFPLRNFFQRMQNLSEAIKPTKSKKPVSKELAPDLEPDLDDYKGDANSLYAAFFNALFDAFGKALGNQNQQERLEDLNQLFVFISFLVDAAPKNMDEVQLLKGTKEKINQNIVERTQHCKSIAHLTAPGPIKPLFGEQKARAKAFGLMLATPEKQGTGPSSIKKSMTMGGSRRRIKHAHKYKKLTKKRRVKKHKTKKYNRHKK